MKKSGSSSINIPSIQSSADILTDSVAMIAARNGHVFNSVEKQKSDEEQQVRVEHTEATSKDQPDEQECIFQLDL